MALIGGPVEASRLPMTVLASIPNAPIVDRIWSTVNPIFSRSAIVVPVAMRC